MSQIKRNNGNSGEESIDSDKGYPIPQQFIGKVMESGKVYDLKARTNKFAHDVVNFTSSLPDNYLGKHINGQLIRAGTSVAANYRAAMIAHSKKAFISKLSIVIEECDESAFWLEFARDEEISNNDDISGLLQEANELTAIFIASRKTAQNKGKG